MRKKGYQQSILIGKTKRPAILETHKDGTCTTFAVKCKGKVIATRSTSKTQDEETAIIRLARAVNGLAYVFIIPVATGGEKIVKQYKKINN